MEAVAEKIYTLEEYLELEYHSNQRHYFFNGQVTPMTYTSNNHGLIVSNIIGELHPLFKKSEFREYPSDRMLYIPECKLNYYPDVMIVKGNSVFHQHSAKMKATTNPYAIIEVLSDSTEEMDRSSKWACYRQITTLQQYFLIAQDRPYIEFFNRIDEKRWENSFADSIGQSVKIAGFDIPLKEIYWDVEFHP